MPDIGDGELLRNSEHQGDVASVMVGNSSGGDVGQWVRWMGIARSDPKALQEQGVYTLETIQHKFQVSLDFIDAEDDGSTTLGGRIISMHGSPTTILMAPTGK